MKPAMRGGGIRKEWLGILAYSVANPGPADEPAPRRHWSFGQSGDLRDPLAVPDFFAAITRRSNELVNYLSLPLADRFSPYRGIGQSAMSAWTSLRHRAGDLVRRWFPERQIILRQHDSVKAIRFAPGIQLVAACVLVAGALWTAGATGAYLASRIAVADVRWENDQLRVGYRFVDRLKEDAASAEIRARELERQIDEARLEWRATLTPPHRRRHAAPPASQGAGD